MAATLSDTKTASPALNLDRVGVDPRWALRIPASYAFRRQVLPLSQMDGPVSVACAKLPDAQVHKAVEKYLAQPCTFIEVDAESLQRALDRVYDVLELDESSQKTSGRSRQEDRDNPVAICDELIHAAVLRGASDIHLVPTEHCLSVHLRVDGVLEPYREIGKALQPIVVSRFKVLAGMDIAEKRAAQDGRITAHSVNNHHKLEIRAASLPTRYGERITLRLLASHSANLKLASLGMSDQDFATFKNATERPHGLILLTGPTGSGKSTTLYLAIEHLLANRGGNVITIEDPIEYEIQGASQVEIDSADKVNFSKALRSVLRHDPDVVMIGEVRDQETADTAIKAALTGHLVFSSLHTNTSAGVVTRLIDMGIEPFLLAATLRISLAQRLVRHLCHKCRRERSITAQEAQILGMPALEGQPTYDPVGCLTCSGKGFLGRIGLFEILENTSEISELIAESAPEAILVQAARRTGASMLLEDGIAKVLSGVTTVAEITSAVSLG